MVFITGLLAGFSGACWFGFGSWFPMGSLVSSEQCWLGYNSLGGFIRFGLILGGSGWCKLPGLGSLSAGSGVLVSSRLLVLVWALPSPCSLGLLWGKCFFWGNWWGLKVSVWFLVLYSHVGPDVTSGCSIFVVVWALAGSGVGCEVWLGLVLASWGGLKKPKNLNFQFNP